MGRDFSKRNGFAINSPFKQTLGQKNTLKFIENNRTEEKTFLAYHSKVMVIKTTLPF